MKSHDVRTLLHDRVLSFTGANSVAACGVYTEPHSFGDGTID